MTPRHETQAARMRLAALSADIGRLARKLERTRDEAEIHLVRDTIAERWRMIDSELQRHPAASRGPVSRGR